MFVKEIHGVQFGFEFTQPEFMVIGRNLRRFGHAAIAAEIRANSPNSTFGRKVNLYADVRHERARKNPAMTQIAETGTIADTLKRLRQERDQMRALLTSEAPIEKEHPTNVLLGTFTTQVAFDELTAPIIQDSSELYEAIQLIDMRNSFVIKSQPIN